MTTDSSSDIIEGSASTIINRAPADVIAAVSDITRMGDWSPECVAGRWVAPATGPAVGAKFEGDNVAKLGPIKLKSLGPLKLNELGPITVKKWTTTSEVTVYEPGPVGQGEVRVFEFISANHSTWRYEFEARDDATLVTESFSYPPYVGKAKFFYETIGRRSKSMVGALEATLARMKTALEA